MPPTNKGKNKLNTLIQFYVKFIFIFYLYICFCSVNYRILYSYKLDFCIYAVHNFFLHDKYLQQHFPYILLYIVSITAVVGMFSFSSILVYCVVANINYYFIISCGLLLFCFLCLLNYPIHVMFMFWLEPVSDPNDVLINDPVLSTLVVVVHSCSGKHAVL